MAPRQQKLKPGEEVSEDDPRYVQQLYREGVKTWRDRLKKPVEGPAKKRLLSNPTRTKDDKYTPPPKIDRAVERWKDRKAPPLLPIQPSVGPVQDAKQSAAIKYKFTPEAADQLRKTHVAMAPQTSSIGGYYSPDQGKIGVFATPGYEMDSRNVIAHEFGHKWWFENLTQPERESYLANHNRWADEGGQYGTANLTTERFNREQQYTDSYKDDAGSRPTETHARVVEMSPVLGSNDIPGYMQPYYRGLLQDVPNPRPIPNPNAVQRQGVDEEGFAGAYKPMRPVKPWITNRW